jgi:hypothetical protein
MSPSGERTSRRDPAAAHAAIERFLKVSVQPVLLEPGADHFVVDGDHLEVDYRNGRVTVHAWDQTRSLVRRVISVYGEKPGKLELVVEKFGKRQGRLLFLDLARPDSVNAPLRERRFSFREQFRCHLSLQFPDWKIAELSTETNLEYSLSPIYPRAFLRRGRSGLAALACPRAGGDAAGALSFGLIWLDYLRRRERRRPIEGLVLFLPQGLERTTCLRLRFLDPRTTQFFVYVYSADGYVDRVDPQDYGNLDTRLETYRSSRPLDARVESWIERLRRLLYVEEVPLSDGSVSLRVHGLQFARSAGAELLFGFGKMTAARESNLAEIERIARELARLRAEDGLDHDNPLYRQLPEHWLESQVRSRLQDLDASLEPGLLYGQVPAFAGGERGVLDLLAVDGRGRLAVLELKVSEDIHLPMQALDYWMRVKWHLDRDEFSQHGYFPGISLSKKVPRLLLIAPSLDFHPTTETILRYFSPEISVERIGLGVEWRKRLRVMFRVRGAEKPI